jgi:glutaredoxin
MGPSLKVTFYTKENCSLCELAHEMIRGLMEEAPFELETVDIAESPDAWDAYREMIPVIEIGEKRLWGRIDGDELRSLLLGKMKEK